MKEPKTVERERRGGCSRAAPGSAWVWAVEYQAFDAEKRSFDWKELVRYKTRKLGDMVVAINKRKVELRCRKVQSPNDPDIEGCE